jgi:hypothetical protein
LEYHVVKWGVVTVGNSKWNGAKNTFVELQKGHLYQGSLRPHPDLGNTTDVIAGAFTSPVLVE